MWSGELCLLIVIFVVIHASSGQISRDRPARRRDNNAEETGGLLPGEDYYNLNLPITENDISCKQRSKCTKRGDLDLSVYDQNCFCDDLCKMYGDCCKDYKGSLPDTIPQGFRLSKRTLSCHRIISIDLTAEIYRVEKCPSDYDDAWVREKCEDDYALDQFLEIPVSGVKTGILYKNYYCSVCSGDQEVSWWNVKWQCENGPTIENSSNNTEKLLDDVWSMGAGNCIYEFTHPTMTYRMCKSHYSRCPKHLTHDPEIDRKCRGPANYVYVNNHLQFESMTFRNEYCAQCYGINSTYLSCRDPRGIGRPEHRPPSSSSHLESFSILLDIPTGTGMIRNRVGHGEDSTLDERQVTFRKCEPDHVYDPFNKVCILIACPPEEDFVQGNCVSEDGTVRTSSTTIDYHMATTHTTTRRSQPLPHTTTEHRTLKPELTYTVPSGIPPRETMDREMVKEEEGVIPEKEMSQEEDNILLSCPLKPYNKTEYSLYVNSSVFIFSIQQLYEKGSYILDGNIVYICNPFVQRNESSVLWMAGTKPALMFQYDRIQSLMSFIGILISLISLLICFIAHMILPPIRTVPGKCIVGLSVSLILVESLLLAGSLHISNEIACLVVGVILHYAVIASFCWSNCLAIDLCKTFSSSSRDPQDEKDTSRYTYHSLYAWIFPAILVGGCVALDILDFSAFGVDEELDQFRPYYGRGLCWITRTNALIFMLALPIGVLVLVNIITFLATLKHMYKVPVVAKEASRRQKDKNRFLLYIALTFVMVLTWTFAFLATFTHLKVLWYIFIVFNSFQGAFICFAFVCTRKVFRLLKTIGRVHKTSNSNYSRPYHRSYSNATNSNNPWGYSRSNFMYEGMDSKVVSQETSI